MGVLVGVLAVFLAVGTYGMPGGWMEQDLSTPELQQEWWGKLADLSIHHGLLSSDHFELVSVKSQVVSGMKYNYTLQKDIQGQTTSCSVIVWTQSWLNKTDVQDDCEDLVADTKRELGGVQPLTDFTQPGVDICIGSMLDNISAQANSMYRMVDSNIISATRQVVAGWMYGFKLEVAQSTCLKNEQTKGFTSSKCSVDSSANIDKSEFEGRCWYQDWRTPMAKLMSLSSPTKDSTDVTLPDAAKSAPKPGLNIDQNDSLLGGDTHDKVPHGGYNAQPSQPKHIQLLGQDDHDMADHGKKLLGQDGHDLVDHLNNVKNLIGGDGHDYQEHEKKLLGGDDHDLVNHIGKLIGGDDHDYLDHVKKLLGGDGHDYQEHVKNLLGKDGHDLVDHVGKLIGGDDHDYQEHVKKLLGGDDHDRVQHGEKLLGQDGHDQMEHGRKLLGGDDHDYVQHVLRQKKANSTQKVLGGDGHDLCHYGMFKDFQEKFHRQYELGEEDKRFSIFCDNMRKARKLQETEKGSAIYGATQFADLTEKEFGQYVGKPWDLTANKGMKRAAIPKGPIPDSYDWREHGAVTPVKNQGSCGSCWAFSTTGNIEGQWAIKKGKLVSLSEQELVDCDKVDEGCNGGLPSNAYKEIERLGGLETESEYKYVGEDEKCQFKKSDVKVTINDSVSISSNETEMAAWLAKNGPISIGINAFAMQFYMGGISHPWSIFCNPKSLDHGVLIVGYGLKDSEPYWIVKNSWGDSWGEKGYYLVYRGSGVCGLNTMCTSAVVD